MIQDKIDETKFFLIKMDEEASKESPDLPAISYFYSAFLSASYSVYDYALHNANRVFKLGLPDEEHWDWQKFVSEAKKQKNSGALKYLDWWRSRQYADNNMSIGKAFSACRRINTHKRPTYKIGVDPKIETGKNEPKDDAIIRIPIKITVELFLQVEGFEQMRIEEACGTYLSTIEKFSEDHHKIIEQIEKEQFKKQLMKKLKTLD